MDRKIDKSPIPVVLEIEKDSEHYYISLDSDKTIDDILSAARKKGNRLSDFEVLGKRLDYYDYVELTQDDSVKLVIADLDNREVRIFDEHDVLTSISLDEGIEEQARVPEHELTFAEQVDMVLSGSASRFKDLKVCQTPEILLRVGCEQLPMLYAKSHLHEAIKTKNAHTHAHGLTVEQIKAMPDFLKSPVMVFDSLTRNDSIVVVTPEYDPDHNPVIISVRPNGHGKHDRDDTASNFVTSMYGKDNFVNFLNHTIEQKKLLYAHKEKSQELFRVLGLQSSKGVNNLSFDTIIHQSRNIVKGFSEKKEEIQMADNTLSQQYTAEELLHQALSELKAVKEELSTVREELTSMREEQAKANEKLEVIGAFVSSVEEGQTFEKSMHDLENVTKTLTETKETDKVTFFAMDTDKRFFTTDGERRTFDNSIEYNNSAQRAMESGSISIENGTTAYIPAMSQAGQAIGVIKVERAEGFDDVDFRKLGQNSEVMKTMALAFDRKVAEDKAELDISGAKNERGLQKYVRRDLVQLISEQKPVTMMRISAEVLDIRDSDRVSKELANVIQKTGRTSLQDNIFRMDSDLNNITFVAMLNCAEEKAQQNADFLEMALQKAIGTDDFSIDIHQMEAKELTPHNAMLVFRDELEKLDKPQEIDFTLGLDGEKIESDLSTRVDKSETQEPQEKGDISPLSHERNGTVGDFLKDTLTPYFDKVIDFCKDVIARDEQEQVNAHTL